MSERAEDLRATAEDLIADADRVKAIEAAKLELKPDDPLVDRLSTESEGIIRRMVPKVVAQRELAASPEPKPG